MSEARNEDAPAAAALRGQVGGVVADYLHWSAEWAGNSEGATPKAGPKDVQARHAALKTALGHLDLLLKVARAMEGGGDAAAAPEEDEAAFEAEAARNLARPA
jgi:hypothetical protein